MEELDGAPRRHGLLRVTAHRFAGQHGHGRTDPLAAPGDELVKDVVEVGAQRTVARHHVQIAVKVRVDVRSDPEEIVDEQFAAHGTTIAHAAAAPPESLPGPVHPRFLILPLTNSAVPTT